ncbi:MAG: hypothetical protein ACP5E5_09660 [Acidobacteriaceae bacterium]
MILEETFVESDLMESLRGASATDKAAVCSFTPDDLEDLIGYIAAEANHAKDKKLRKGLDRLFEKLEASLQAYGENEERRHARLRTRTDAEP